MSLLSLAEGVDVAHSDAKDYIKTAAAYQHDRDMQDRGYVRSVSLNQQMASLAGEARRSSYSDAVEGAKRAGLHPAVAAGAGFGSVAGGGSVGTPSSGGIASDVPRGLGKLALESQKYSESERSLMAAQARNLNADAENKEIDAQNKKDENDSTRRLATSYYQSIVDSSTSSGEEKEFATAMLNTPLSAGSVKGYNQLLESYPKYSGAIRDKLKNEVEQKVEFDKFLDEDYAGIVSQLPKEQVINIREQTKNLAGQSALLALELERTKQDTELIKRQQALVNKNIEYLGQLIKATHNKDFIDLWNNGQYLGSIMTYTSGLLPSAIGAAGTIVGAKTLTKGRSPNPAFQKGGLYDNEKGSFLQHLEY